MKYFTGIGSRETPSNVQRLMTSVSVNLLAEGYCLRSGGADGADTAFYNATKELEHSSTEIFLPWNNFNGYEYGEGFFILEDFALNLKITAWEIIKKVHPNAMNMKESHAKLHARNVFQVLGQDLKTPSEVVICWTPEGKEVGGTRTAIKIAQMYGVPVWNLGI